MKTAQRREASGKPNESPTKLAHLSKYPSPSKHPKEYKLIY